MNKVNQEMDRLDSLLPEWVENSRPESAHGRVAVYIPELSKAQWDLLGISVLNADGRYSEAGDTEFCFTLQSISKVFTLILALMDHGEEAVFAKVGKEPTGDNFNSMMKLELIQPAIPFNPLINAGAIVISSLIQGDSAQQKSERILQFFRKLAGNEHLTVDSEVYRSERETGHLNRSMAYFLLDKGILEGNVEEVLDVYFRHCSIQVKTADLARMALVLAYNGLNPLTGEQLIPRRYVQIAKTFMITCGMYNGSGEFAIGAGMPAKSGVSGGILTFVPGRLGIGVVGPSLNAKGNSIAGVHLLERLSREFDWSMF
ncbi:glutaminase A [Paenibacillus yonginensis]|uniref:Glutaminase n=1 Tax=Paenibacillus yonginensis TaxID=1462996 RepID=A0A1B1MYG8_9BACL|nr:glutaminase A [Paenibacillus yonginensis]ANS74215.1 glutaminase A [Paenibacillus yonginensis]